MIWFYRAKAWIWLSAFFSLVADKFDALARRCTKCAEDVVEKSRGF